MPEIGVPELLIVAVIVLLLFGPGKAADIGGSLGKSIREFRRASTEDSDPKAPLASASTQASAITTDAVSPVAASAVASEKFCTNCGAAFANEQRFCTSCGTARA